MTKIIALFNQAGGVGKTTLTINVGFHLAELKKKILLIDMDSQGSLTKYMGIARPKELETTIYDALIDNHEIPVYQGINNMDLVPANRQLSGITEEIAGVKNRQFRLKEALKPISSQYDYILIDCPPALGLLSIMALTAATHVLIPIEAQEKALEGTEELFETLNEVIQYTNPKLKLAGAVPCLYEGRENHEKTSLEAIREAFQEGMFPPIAKYTDFKNAWRAHKPLAIFYPEHVAVITLRKIAKKLETV